MGSVWTIEAICEFLFSVIRVTTPLFFVAMATLVTRKAGLLNMASESMMLAAALTGVLVSGETQSLAIGVAAGLVASAAVAFIISYSAFILKTDLYLTCIATNTALAGATVFVMYLATGDKMYTVQSVASKAFGNVDIPLLKDIPLLGSIFSGHNVLTYVSVVGVVIMWFFLFKTRLGLRIRSVGENPKAAESVGIKPTKIYFISFLVCSVYAGLGGIYMSMGYMNYFLRDMMAGRGFIGMSAMNVSGARPFLSMLTSLMFGFSQALSNYMQLSNIPSEIVSMLPYIATVLILIIASSVRIIIVSGKSKKAAKKHA